MIKVFSIKRLIIMLGWAESLSWQVTTEKETRTLYFAIHKTSENSSGANAYGVIIGPITIMMGYAQ